MNIEKLKKGGQLVEIEPEKVSLVKSPANQRRFIFTKAANLEFSGSTDQTFDGTTISVNGEEVEDLDSFHLSVVNWSDEDMEEWGATPVSMSFTRRLSTEDGMDKVETFSLHSEVKKEMEKSEVIKAVNEHLGIELDEAKFDKLPVEKQKALTGLATFSPALNGQPAFRDAISVFVKDATAEEAEPTTPSEETPPETPPETPADDARLSALEASIKAINEKLDKDPDGADADNDTDPVTKADLEVLSKQLSAIAKNAGVKDSSETDVNKSEGGGGDPWEHAIPL